MAWNNITDLYNSTLEDDKPIVDNIILAIKTQIETNTDTNGDHFFDYDMNDVLTTEEDVQIGRIRDQVIFILRAIGIRVQIIDPTKLHIEWLIRDNREFMKQYY